MLPTSTCSRLPSGHASASSTPPAPSLLQPAPAPACMCVCVCLFVFLVFLSRNTHPHTRTCTKHASRHLPRSLTPSPPATPKHEQVLQHDRCLRSAWDFCWRDATRTHTCARNAWPFRHTDLSTQCTCAVSTLLALLGRGLLLLSKTSQILMVTSGVKLFKTPKWIADAPALPRLDQHCPRPARCSGDRRPRVRYRRLRRPGESPLKQTKNTHIYAMNSGNAPFKYAEIE